MVPEREKRVLSLSEELVELCEQVADELDQNRFRRQEWSRRKNDWKQGQPQRRGLEGGAGELPPIL
ncbi:MAG: hypothetical protein H7A21_00165 [Spirochaetales bacterium]|nr:hypothetical protein [Leptospiraceae bacterium]MCP5479823.1 hypothetical protein [Spirochaetales bacterium]